MRRRLKSGSTVGLKLKWLLQKHLPGVLTKVRLVKLVRHFPQNNAYNSAKCKKHLFENKDFDYVSYLNGAFINRCSHAL